MDEPFSSLDISTSKNLREEIIRFWMTKAINTKSMIIVTHNNEEAVLIAYKIIMFGSNPGRVNQEVSININHPREVQDIAVRHIYFNLFPTQCMQFRLKFLYQTAILKKEKRKFTNKKSIIEGNM